MERPKTITTENEYEAQAQMLAASLGLTIKIAYKGDRCPPWADGSARGKLGVTHCGGCGSVHGDRYRVTLRKRKDGDPLRAQSAIAGWVGAIKAPAYYSLSFDYWGSYRDKLDGKRPGYYNILSCVASDASAPTDPDEVAKEYGAMPPSQAVAVAKHAARLQAFFTSTELTALGEIQ